MLDTKGPSIRTGKLEGNEPVLLRAGDNFFLTEDDIAGTSRRVHQTFKGLYKYVEPGTIILIDDGLIELAVDRILGPISNVPFRTPACSANASSLTCLAPTFRCPL